MIGADVAVIDEPRNGREQGADHADQRCGIRAAHEPRLLVRDPTRDVEQPAEEPQPDRQVHDQRVNRVLEPPPLKEVVLHEPSSGSRALPASAISRHFLFESRATPTPWSNVIRPPRYIATASTA